MLCVSRFPVVASPRRRLLALGVDAGLLMVAVAAALAASIRRALFASEGTGRNGRLFRVLADPRLAYGLHAVTIITTVASRGWRSPGCRVAGIRRVDVHTGGPESRRAALTRGILSVLVRMVIHRLNTPHRQRMHARQALLQRLRADLQNPPTDPALRPQATEVDLDRQSARDCLCAIVKPLALTSIVPLTALLSPTRRNVIERLAGVAFTRDPPR